MLDNDFDGIHASSPHGLATTITIACPMTKAAASEHSQTADDAVLRGGIRPGAWYVLGEEMISVK